MPADHTGEQHCETLTKYIVEQQKQLANPKPKCTQTAACAWRSSPAGQKNCASGQRRRHPALRHISCASHSCTAGAQLDQPAAAAADVDDATAKQRSCLLPSITVPPADTSAIKRSCLSPTAAALSCFTMMLRAASVGVHALDGF